MSMPDSIDEQLVRLLAQDGRQSSEMLAKGLNLSSATVRRRLRKLIRDDVLRIVGVVDPYKFGFAVAVIISLDVTHDKLGLAMEALGERPEIKWVSTTTGRFDILAMARFRSNNGLAEFMTEVLAKLEGVKDSETFLCLDVKKGRYIQLPLQ